MLLVLRFVVIAEIVCILVLNNVQKLIIKLTFQGLQLEFKSLHCKFESRSYICKAFSVLFFMEVQSVVLDFHVKF